MADEMDENLNSNDETRVRLPGNERICTKQSSKRRSKSKKRTFHGNAYSKSSTPKSSSKVVNNTETVLVLQSQEVDQKYITFYQKNLKELEGYRLCDMVIFKDIIKSFGFPNCNQLYM